MCVGGGLKIHSQQISDVQWGIIHYNSHAVHWVSRTVFISFDQQRPMSPQSAAVTLISASVSSSHTDSVYMSTCNV